MQKTQDESMHEILAMQKQEANVAWGKFVERNYIDWLNGKDKNPPTLSHTLLKNKLSSELENSTSARASASVARQGGGMSRNGSMTEGLDSGNGGAIQCPGGNNGSNGLTTSGRACSSRTKNSSENSCGFLFFQRRKDQTLFLPA